MSNLKRKCDKCKTQMIKVRDFIKQSGYSYYLECPKCTKEYLKRKEK
jgi:uncharacterized Zn finger protein